MQNDTYDLKGKGCLVLLSGGQDSTTCLWWAKKMFGSVHAIGFDYGQSHVVELAQAALIGKRANVDSFHVMNLKGLLGGSSLVDLTLDHNENHARDSSLPASFTAGRNAVFLSLAASYAYNMGIHDIVTGVCQTDFSGYPDCRRRFVDAMQCSLSLALDRDIRIHTPLMYLSKAETWKLAKELDCYDVVVELSVTDYNGTLISNEWGYGVEDNPATILRAKGWREARERGWV